MHQFQRHLSISDRLISHFDQALRTLTSNGQTRARTSPAEEVDGDEALSGAEKRHAAGLMRVNHAGEVCAQALYQGQSITAKLPRVRADMEQAAAEEIDHLAWCEERLDALGGAPSRLNPLWYGLSLGLGAGAGLISDKVSLGFVAATEEQVCKHLQAHLKALPPQDHKSRAVVEAMLKDEEQHGQNALRAGGYNFPKPVKWGMTLASRLMTHTSYRI